FRHYVLVDASMEAAFGQRNTGGERGKVGTVQVTARTCDEVVATLGLRRVDLVKIDAESSELHVLFGAERLIQEFAPLLILEVGDFDLPGVARSRDLVSWLTQRGYVAYEARQGDISRHQPRGRNGPGNLRSTRAERRPNHRQSPPNAPAASA